MKKIILTLIIACGVIATFTGCHEHHRHAVRHHDRQHNRYEKRPEKRPVKPVIRHHNQKKDHRR